MSFHLLSQKSLSLFEAVGGWRTVAEAVSSRVVFLVAYLLTEEVAMSALIAVGVVAVFVVVRVWKERKYWSAGIGLLVVGLSAALAGSTGRAVDFYLHTVLWQSAAAVLFLGSMVIGRPLVGVAVGRLRGERFTWRKDPVQRRKYQICTSFFMVRSVIAATVLVPLYLTEKATALGVAATVLAGAPALGLCAYLSWRVLRTQEEPAVESRVAAPG